MKIRFRRRGLSSVSDDGPVIVKTSCSLTYVVTGHLFLMNESCVLWNLYEGGCFQLCKTVSWPVVYVALR